MLELIYFILGAMLISSPIAYVFYLMGILHGAAMFFLGLGALWLLIAFFWMLSCRGKGGGCFSGVIFTFPIILLPLGTVMYVADYLIK
jgi:hypothetical protein